MNHIAVTQRVDLVESYDERRDAIDQRWTDFLLTLDLLPVFIPNDLAYAKRLTRDFPPDGVLFTGGNSLCRYGGRAPERDEMEHFLLKWSMGREIPVLGVCRGMQVIQDYHGIPLEPVSGHVATRHPLQSTGEGRLAPVMNQMSDVNAYHELGANTTTGDLITVAKAPDGVVMAVEHKTKPVFGVMWHPEREEPFRKEDQGLFRAVFQ